jgi:hypothetical protein
MRIQATGRICEKHCREAASAGLVTIGHVDYKCRNAFFVRPMKQHSQSGKEIKTSLAPMLSVRRGASAIDFYKRAFGAEELFRIEGDGGDVVARMSVDGADFWLADESPKHCNFSPESLGGGSVRLVLDEWETPRLCRGGSRSLTAPGVT